MHSHSAGLLGWLGALGGVVPALVTVIAALQGAASLVSSRLEHAEVLLEHAEVLREGSKVLLEVGSSELQAGRRWRCSPIEREQEEELLQLLLPAVSDEASMLRSGRALSAAAASKVLAKLRHSTD